MLKAVIFDLDGTLLNTLDDLADSTNFALRSTGLKERTLDEVRRFVGNGVYKLIERAVPTSADAETINRVYEIFKSHYIDNSSNKTDLYPGIKDLLLKLSDNGVKTAIVSNKLNEAVVSLRNVYFTMIPIAIGETPDVSKKPSPDMVFNAIKLLSVEKDEVLYVGDSEVDIETAKNAGVRCISVSWGFRDERELLQFGAERIAHDPSELCDMLLECAKR